ncbi:MAG: chromate transporter [Chloroflexi bacterium]|nr:chromate transporter [Chloroflexota bacterium]
MAQSPTPTEKGSLGELARLFLRLGLIAFGGPAAHIAMFRDEVVNRRKWITDEHFLDMLGATNLIPGPNSTEMAIHIGLLRAGWRGLVITGVCFILPAMLIVLGLAILYDEYGTTPTAEWLLYGIKPVIIAVVLQAVWGLSRKAIKNRVLAVIGIVAFGLYLLGLNELLLMFGGGLIAMGIANARRLRQAAESSAIKLLSILPPGPFLVQGYSANGHEVSLLTLFLTFLKIGATLYGSGYVLLAFVQNDFVERLGWLTNEQLLDAVAIGQFTPGPVFTTATFIGYLVAGVPGAILATVAIFLPAFVFVYLSSPFIPRLRQSKWLGSLLDGVNVAALGLMAAVTFELGRDALVDWVTVLLATASAVLLIRFKVNSTWLIVGGALVGLLKSLI